ncbi:hypothetical protein HMPREF0239_03882 [Clostridium sp. ATCC BAA-442]|uniref:Uncharacterized protein n=1 Tax=Flavonifractor plautii ATCC 29863 TaxID=411475 RepID=G9YVI4_FLAPL|nr:hypothetical protein HMPREF0372_03549 [Flavonifractor plautii ATCC 29863]ERI67853.1 hypothetical protein HMPREF0239_03882 [Clostridium sp. ATCC BAA-442]
MTGSDIELIPPKKCTAAQTGNSAMRYGRNDLYRRILFLRRHYPDQV